MKTILRLHSVSPDKNRDSLSRTLKSQFITLAICIPIISGLFSIPFGKGWDGASFAQPIAGGKYFSLALCTDGTLKSWGDDGWGFLGNETGDGDPNRTTPVSVSSLTGITNVSSKWWHSLALDNNGNVWAWGYGGYGELGLGDGLYANKFNPVQVKKGSSGCTTYLCNIKTVSAGNYYSLALDNNGNIWSWGNSWTGQLGDGSSFSYRDYPAKVHGLNDVGFLEGITAIAAGGFSLALDNNGNVWAWGFNTSGQLGNGTWTSPQTTPTKVVAGGASSCGTYLCDITAVAAGSSHSLALDINGNVWAWGENFDGQLGNGTSGGGTNTNTPAKVLKGEASGCTDYLCNIIAIAAAQYHSLALDVNGNVWAWGYNSFGELGNGDNIYATKSSPVQVHGQNDVGFLTGITSISTGFYHSFALKSDGSLWVWGYGGYGQLGNGSTTMQQNTPVQPTGLCEVMILPIELLSFDATPVKKQNNEYYVHCEWSTASEMNNDYFAIENSQDGKTFAQIGTTKGGGNSSTTLHYRFDDQLPYTDLSYYRLKQVDYDGKFSYSNIVPVRIGTLDIISIYSNPAEKVITTKIAVQENTEATTEVFNILGEQVFLQSTSLKKGVTEVSVDTQAFVSGIYTFRITLPDKEHVQKMFVK